MKYMLVNTGTGAVQVDLHNPNPAYNRKNLHRPGPVVAINIPRGEAKDILPYFNGNLEEAHKCVKHSKDTLKQIRPGLIHAYVCDDNMKPIDVDAVLSGKTIKNEASKKSDPDITKPSLEPAVIAAEERKLVDTPPPPVETESSKEKEPDPEPSEEKEPDPEDLTILDGVGRSSSQKLHDAGYLTVASVATANVDDLKKIIGKHAIEAKASAEALFESDDNEIVE